MTVRQPWLRDRRLQAVPVGWRHAAWVARLIAAEHGLAVEMTVAWAPPDSMGTPTLSIGGYVMPTPTLPAIRQRNQQIGLKAACRRAATVSGLCMACGDDDSPGHVPLTSAGAIDVVAMLCIACEELADADGGAFWPAISRYDPLAHEDAQDLTKGWTAEPPDDVDDLDEGGTPEIWER